ncbi:MAG: hypothetical protein QOD77_1241 [Thermoplasmata archaeon]|jgi:hypothetical protein|nr:hypothetical protein [Thermoplasmata archaeon]
MDPSKLRIPTLLVATAFALASFGALPATAGPAEDIIVIIGGLGCAGTECPDFEPCPDNGTGDANVVCSYPCEEYDSDPSTAVIGTILYGPLGIYLTDLCAEDCTWYYDYATGTYRDPEGYVLHASGFSQPACYEMNCYFYDGSETNPYRYGDGVTLNGDEYCASPCGVSAYDPAQAEREGYTIVTPFAHGDGCYENGCRHDDYYGYPTYNPGIGVSKDGTAYCAEECQSYSYDYYADQEGYSVVVGDTRVPACYEQGCRYSDGGWSSYKTDGTGVTLNEQTYCAENCGAYSYYPYADQEGYTVVAPGQNVPACYEQACRYPTWYGSETTDGTGVTVNGQPTCAESCPDGQEGTTLVVAGGSPIPACQDVDPLVQAAIDAVNDAVALVGEIAADAQEQAWALVGAVGELAGDVQEQAEQAVDGATNDPPCAAGGIEAAGTCIGPITPCTPAEGNGFHLGFANVCTGSLSVESCSTGTPPPTLGVVVGGTPVCVPTPTVGLCPTGQVGAVVNGQAVCVPIPTAVPCETGYVGVIVNGQRVCTPMPTAGLCETGYVGVIVNGQRVCVAEPTTGPCAAGEVGMVVNGQRACVPEPKMCTGPGEVGVEVGAQRLCQTPPTVSGCDPPRQGVVIGTFRVCL